MKTRLLVLLLMVLLRVGSFGETMGVESLEWKAMDSPLVIRGKVIAERVDRQALSFPAGTITIAVLEVLRGEWKEPNVEVYVGRNRHDTGPEEWVKSGRDYLFFLRPATRFDSREIEGKWIFRERSDSVFDLVQPNRAYGADMSSLKDGKEILDRVRLWAGQSSREIDFGEPGYGRRTAGSIRIDVLGGSVLDENYSGSLVFMIVPAEEKHREMALELIASNDDRQRSEGASILGNLPDDAASNKLLQELLSDAGEAQSSYSGHELVEVTYPVRQAAWIALTSLGRKPQSKPVLRRMPTPEEREKLRLSYWSDSIASALGKEWEVASVEFAPAPPGWTRRQGADGFAIKCETGPEEKPASFMLYVMPKESLVSNSQPWTAFNEDFALDDSMRQSALRVTRKKRTSNGGIADYLGVSLFNAQGAFHVFVLPQCPAGIRAKLVRRWELKIVKRDGSR